MAIESQIIQGELTLRGLSISKGIGIGLPILVASPEDDVPDVPILKKEVEAEIERYRKALAQSRKDVEKLRRLSLQEGPPEVVAILGTHLEIMQDPLITQVIEDKIRASQHNTESIFRHVIEEYKVRFSTLQDSYFQERVRDIVDVSRRILSYLRPLEKISMGEIPHNSVILTQELVPSETVEATTTLVSGFVTAAGGITSHVAIIARAKGIPYVANIDIKMIRHMNLRSIIVDGSEGVVIINPTRQTLKKYQELKRQHLEEYKMLASASHLRAETIDGYEVRLFANLENPKELENAVTNGAGGIGLFRSEYLFLTQRKFPSEEEQFVAYKRMARALKGKPLVIRVFDIGGDKKIDLGLDDPGSKYFRAIGPEFNPALGCRAIRFLLRFPELLDTQLRAILRASAYGDVQILIPMLADLSELRIVRGLVQKIQADLKEKGIKTAKEVPIGCMIEVPSSAIMCDAIVQEADFLSIGTNDLVQYVLAADRSNPSTATIYHAIHPSVLRLIRMVVASANRFRKPVIVCGECAADPMMVPLLIGLGLREFSVAARHIPLVKHTVRKWRILEACRLAENALEYTSAQDLRVFLDQETKK